MPTTWLWRFQYLNLKGEINSQSKYFILAPPRPNILLKSKLPPNRLKGNGPACKFCWTGFGTLWFQGVQTPCLCWVPIMLGWAVFLNLRHLRNGMPVCEGSVSLPSWESMDHTSQSLLLSYSTLSNPLTSSPHLYSFEKIIQCMCSVAVCMDACSCVYGSHVCTSKWKPKFDIRSLLLSLYLFLQAASFNWTQSLTTWASQARWLSLRTPEFSPLSTGVRGRLP